MWALILGAAIAVTAGAADLKPVFPANAPKPLGPYVPGVSAGSYLYVSGQGARNASGTIPATFEEQVRQCMQNVQNVLAADGLGMQNVVWTQVYLQSIVQASAFDKIYSTFFSKDPPARSMIGVAKLPGGTPIEIAAVAVRDLKQRKIISLAAGLPMSNAVQVGERVYVSGVLGRDVKNSVPKDPRRQVDLLVTQMKAVLAKAGMELRDMAYAHVYIDGALPFKLLSDILTETLPSETAIGLTQTAALPSGAHIEISGIASRKGKRTGACVSLEDIVYCPSVAGPVDQALARVKANLETAKLDMSRVVISSVFLDEIESYAAMNKIYAGAFGKWLPARVTLQPTQIAEELNLAPGTTSPVPKSEAPRAQISIIAIR